MLPRVAWSLRRWSRSAVGGGEGNPQAKASKSPLIKSFCSFWVSGFGSFDRLEAVEPLSELRWETRLMLLGHDGAAKESHDYRVNASSFGQIKLTFWNLEGISLNRLRTGKILPELPEACVVDVVGLQVVVKETINSGLPRPRYQKQNISPDTLVAVLAIV